MAKAKTPVKQKQVAKTPVKTKTPVAQKQPVVAAKKVEKQPVSKKVSTEVKKEAVEKSIEKKVVDTKKAEKVKPLSQRTCELIVSKKSEEECVEILKKEYPTLKLVNKGTITYYRRFILAGKMSKYGFNPDSIEEKSSESSVVSKVKKPIQATSSTVAKPVRRISK